MGFSLVPINVACGHRLGEAFQWQGTNVAEVVPAATAGEQTDKVSDEDLSAASHAAEPGGLDHWGTEPVALLEGRLPDADPDANTQRNVSSPVCVIDAALHRLRAPHRFHRAGERNHQPITKALDFRALERRNYRPQRFEVLSADRIGAFFADFGN
jgi:hypothetical protein